MKPFNLEQAKQGKKVVTRDGIEVEQLTHNPNARKMYRVVAWVDGSVCSYDENGKMWETSEGTRDLFMATEKKTMYIAVADDDTGNRFNLRLTSNAYCSENELKEQAGRGVVMSGKHQIVSFEIEV